MRDCHLIKKVKFFILFIFCLFLISIDLFAQIEVVKQKPEQVLKTDSIARFRGGDQLLFEFLETNFIGGDSLTTTKKGKSYAVNVTFIVDSAGKLSDIQVTHLKKTRLPVTPEVKNELVRIIGIMPQWSPGKRDNKYISSLVILPLNFILQSGKMKILMDNDVPRKKLGKEKWVIVAASLILLAAVALIGIK